MGESLKNRKSNRWQGNDYSWPGYYFITICAKDKNALFGEIKQNKMQLNESGQIANNFWQEIPKHFNNCELDEFMVMPNHIHGVIEMYLSDDFKTADDVGTGLKPVPTGHGLSEIISGFKTFSARKINEFRDDKYFQWQRSFYDRVIRSQKELSNIRNYITSNPIDWQLDRNNPINIK